MDLFISYILFLLQKSVAYCFFLINKPISLCFDWHKFSGSLLISISLAPLLLFTLREKKSRLLSIKKQIIKIY